MLELTRGKISTTNKKYGGKFAPKYRAFKILQNNNEDVVKKSTQMWKLIYGLNTVKAGEEDPFEGRRNRKRKGRQHCGGDTKAVRLNGNN